MKRLGSFLLSALFILCSVLPVGAAVMNPDEYINSSTPSKTTNSKIIDYINKKKSEGNGTVYCINRDQVLYYETFFDEERDYEGLAFSQHFKSNATIPEMQKKLKTGSIYFRYTHSPEVYDNQAAVSSLAGSWFPCKITWDAQKKKWSISDDAGLLFQDPTDRMRGKWKIELKGTDATGKNLFDKESVGFAQFLVHKAPVPKITFSESGDTATLQDGGSYDLDYQYKKNSKKNIANDREYSGIKEFYWSAKIGENWVDAGTGPVVTFQKNGKQVTDYMLTVEDYDGAFTSVSQSSLILEKPQAQFEFQVGNKTTEHVYIGNRGHETIQVNPFIAWNDEAYSNPPYTSSGTRTEKWTALATMENRDNTETFNLDIMKKRFSNIIKNNKIQVELEAKNKYDYYDTDTKTAEIVTIATTDKTGTEGTTACLECYAVIAPKKPFAAGTAAKIILENNNNKVHFEELKVVLNAPEAGINNMEMELKNNRFQYDIPLKNPDSYNKVWWDGFDYEFLIYSKRTGEFLHQETGNIFIHTPITVDGFINGSDEETEINTDEPIEITAETTKYTEKVTVKFPVDVIVDEKVIKAGDPIELTPDDSSHTKWSVDIIISSDTVSEDTKITAEFEAESYNKRDKGTDEVEAVVVSYRLLNFRITKIRDFKLAAFYEALGKFKDIEMNVDYMAIDAASFAPFVLESLTKGYLFEFKIDSINFNEEADTIVITPSFYTMKNGVRIENAKNGYWIDSNKRIWKIGEGGHEQYASIVLTKENREITDKNKATWSGKYMIPGSSFLSDSKSTSNALANKVDGDIIVYFDIEGYKNRVPKFNYNLKQWGKERKIIKNPYKIGDVIRYDGKKSNLDDLEVIRVRP